MTSDKCYANDESGRRFTEDDPLGGTIRIARARLERSWSRPLYRHSYFPPSEIERHGVAIATARAGNVIAGGDWTPHGVVADIVRSVTRGEPIRLRRPGAIRPWQHVLEPLGGYLTLAVRLGGPDPAAWCDAWNFGPEPEDEATVRELTEGFLARWGTGSWLDDSRPDDPPEAGVLRLSIERASETRVATTLASGRSGPADRGVERGVQNGSSFGSRRMPGRYRGIHRSTRGPRQPVLVLA